MAMNKIFAFDYIVAFRTIAYYEYIKRFISSYLYATV